MKNGLIRIRNNGLARKMFSAGFLLVGIVLLSRGNLREVRLGRDSVSGSVSGPLQNPGPSKRSQLGWYVRSGQWRADMRSVAAAIQYLSDSAAVPQTNGPVSKADQV
jgi:hypothetical protein